jgi:hypothetical protein
VMGNAAFPGLAPDFRRRLLIDRYSSVLSRLPLRRQLALADPARVDAEIWNVFRTLAQLDPARWLPKLLSLGRIRFPQGQENLSAGIGLTLWKRIKPPAERLAWLRRRALRGDLRPPVGRRRKGRVIPLSELRDELKGRARERLPLEEPVEVDAIVKCPGSVLFVQVPRQDDSPHEPSSSDAGRTFLLRLMDAGISYAEARSRAQRRPVGWSLLILTGSAESELTWSRALRPLASSPARLRRELPHRGGEFDPSSRMLGLGIGAWGGMAGLLRDLRRGSSDPFEAVLLDRLLFQGESREVPAGI